MIRRLGPDEDVNRASKFAPDLKITRALTFATASIPRIGRLRRSAPREHDEAVLNIDSPKIADDASGENNRRNAATTNPTRLRSIEHDRRSSADKHECDPAVYE